MGKNKQTKDGSKFPDVYQEPNGVEGKEDKEDPPHDSGSQGTDFAASAEKLKSKIAVAPSAMVNSQTTQRADSGLSEAGNMARVAAGFGGRAEKGDSSRIPYRSKANRPGTIDGKRNFDAARELDETASEFVLPEVDEATGLHESSTAEQLYNGRKVFVKERAKKNAVEKPQSLLFNASADMDISSFVVSTCGQVAGSVPPEADYPLVGPTGDPITNPMHKSNYLLNALKITISEGKISAVSFDETKVNAPTNFNTSEEANFNWKVDRNNVSKAMDKLQLKYGIESADQWSPLGYAIEYPYEHNMLLHDIDATTGAIAAAAVRAGNSALSFQRNVIHKDGNDSQEAAVRMFLEGYAGSLADSKSITDDTNVQGYCFNKTAYRKGSAAAIIEIFDSVSKYTRKSHFFTFAGGLPKSINEGNAQYKPLRVKRQFIKAMDKAHMYSTFDGQYSPLLPVYCTRTIRLMNPLSLNFFLKDWKRPEAITKERLDLMKEGKLTKAKRLDLDLYFKDTGVKAAYGYAYNEEANRYFTRITHPVVNGLMKWLLDHEHKIAAVYGNGEITIPCDFNFMYPSMFQHMLCSAMRDICIARKDPLRDILAKSMQATDYVWEDLQTLEECDPLKATQLTIVDKDSPLVIGKLADDTKLRLMWGSNYHVVHSNGNNSITYMMPWYMSSKSFQPNTTNGYNNASGYFARDEYAYMNFPSIRRGVNHAFVDMLHNFKESEIRLALDRYLDIPMFTTFNTDSGFVTEVSRISDRDRLSSGDDIAVGSVKYDNLTSGRVVVRYKTDNSILPGGVDYLSELSIFTIPKELGWIWEATPGMVPIIKAVSIDKNKNIEIQFYRNGIDNSRHWMGGNAREVRSYRVEEPYSDSSDIVQASALHQVYRTAYADSHVSDVNKLYTEFCGIALDSSYGSHKHEDIACVFVPSSTATTDKMQFSKFTSDARYMWSLLQRFYIPDSPFYNCYDNQEEQEKSGYTRQDPLETTFYFGLCGMLPTDYMTAVRSRLNISDQLSSDYTEDVYSEKSLLFR